MNNPYRKNAALWGVTASGALLALYGLLMSLLSSPADAWAQYIRLWPWMTLLIIGFGIQVGLYAHVRITARDRTERGEKAAVAASGGISTTSMLACCAHHLTDVLPVLGLTALTVFLQQYQILFLVIGLLSNIVGMCLMLMKIQEHHLYTEENTFMIKLMRVSFRIIFFGAVGVSASIFIITLLLSVGGKL